MTRSWLLLRAIFRGTDSEDETRELLRILESPNQVHKVIQSLRVAGISEEQSEPIIDLGDDDQYRLQHDVSELYQIFRDDLKFSNVEVQDWLIANSSIWDPIRRRSLRNYLLDVLRDSKKENRSRIMRDARRYAALGAPEPYTPERKGDFGAPAKTPHGDDIDILVTMFRDSLGFSTTDVERWIERRYDIRLNSNKESLLKYLRRVIQRIPVGGSTRLMRDLDLEITQRSRGSDDVREYSDWIAKRGS